MKIKITEMEANAEELRSCNTVAQNLNRLLAMAFSPKVDEDDDGSEDDE